MLEMILDIIHLIFSKGGVGLFIIWNTIVGISAEDINTDRKISV